MTTQSEHHKKMLGQRIQVTSKKVSRKNCANGKWSIHHTNNIAELKEAYTLNRYQTE